MTVPVDGAVLAGTLWLPDGLPHADPVATVVMHPGSGPSGRDNDVYFPPIRAHLLRHGVAVASFDKRGVGGSTGRWQDAGIVEQADDLLAAVDAVRAHVGGRLGVFGHSQGGWVVAEAAGRGRSSVDFVVGNSGPGVTPAEQERYAARRALLAAGRGDDEVAAELAQVDLVFGLLRDRVPYEAARDRLTASALRYLPDDGDEWGLFARILDYDPRPALSRASVPVLALFGADDAVVPVAESVAAYRAAVRPDLLTVAVLPGGDHRLQRGEPPHLVDGYLDTLTGFVRGRGLSTGFVVEEVRDAPDRPGLELVFVARRVD